MLPRLIAFGGVWAGLLGLGLLWFAASGSLRQASGFTMGTTWSAQWVARPWREPGFAPAAEFDELLAHLDRQVFSTYAADSEVSRLNAQPVGAAMPLSGELFEVLRLSREIAALTGGAFDATAGALVDLWDSGRAIRLPPILFPIHLEFPLMRKSAKPWNTSARTGSHLIQPRARQPGSARRKWI